MSKAIKTSPNIATVGRVLLVHSQQWEGERPGIVVRMGVGNDGNQCVSLNVMFDGFRDYKVLAKCRRVSSGNTFLSVPVFDALRHDERAELVKLCGTIAEWPRLPTVAARE